MSEKNIVVAGVGGQGVLTVAHLLMMTAQREGYYVLQSEIHGLSQRGGAVNAQIVLDRKPVTSPLVLEGNGDLLIGLEPLETLRNISMIKNTGTIITSTVPVKKDSNYPDQNILIKELEQFDNTFLIDTKFYCTELKSMRVGNLILLGMLSHYLPFKTISWVSMIKQRFINKSESIINKSTDAFIFGQSVFKNNC